MKILPQSAELIAATPEAEALIEREMLRGLLEEARGLLGDRRMLWPAEAERIAALLDRALELLPIGRGVG